MLKRYFYRDNDTASLTANKSQNNTAQNKDNVSVEQAASVACVLEDTEEEVAVKDAETLPLYNFNQKETVKDKAGTVYIYILQQNFTVAFAVNSTKNKSVHHMHPSFETATETISDLENVGRQRWMRSEWILRNFRRSYLKANKELTVKE